MIRSLSTTTEKIYQYVGKPILFKVAPDTVHQQLVKTGSTLQRSALVRKVLQKSWAYDNRIALSQTIHGTTFKNPVGLSAGFDKNFKLPLLMNAIGFGFMEGGSVTLDVDKLLQKDPKNDPRRKYTPELADNWYEHNAFFN